MPRGGTARRHGRAKASAIHLAPGEHYPAPALKVFQIELKVFQIERSMHSWLVADKRAVRSE